MSQDTKGQLPVTVVSGYLGAGKTTLVNRVLSNQQGYEVAVIVNDMGEVNVDANLIARKDEAEGIVDLSNGCICCRLQDDLLTEARRLVETREFDYLLVEASGVSEPVPIAQTFTENASERFQLDTMVTVLDSYGFWKEFDPDASVPSEEDEPGRPLSEVFVESIEFCDVLILNKRDMVPADALDEIESLAADLQPRTKRVRTSYSEVDPGLVLDTGRFDFEAVSQSQGWKRHLQGDGHNHDHDHSTPAERHGVSSFVYRAESPFDPPRLAAWLDDWEESVVRAKGICNVAGHDDVIGVSRAGPAVQAGPIGEWGEDERATRLVFIGREMPEDHIRSELNERLVDAEEREATEQSPFPL